MGMRQCGKCTRFFDPDRNIACWCEPAVPPDNFTTRAVGFFMSCYNSVIPSRAELLVNYLVEHLDGLEPSARYAAVAHAAKAATVQEVREVLAAALVSHLGPVTKLKPFIDLETCNLMGHPVPPEDPAGAQRWLQEALLDRPMTLSIALQGWLRDLGFPLNFCNDLTLEYSTELAEWLLGVRRG